MAAHRLSSAARRLLAEDVDSVMALELVLLLHADASTPWTVQAAARELRTAEAWVAAQLSALTAIGIARRADGGQAYAFDATDPTAPAVEEIADQYRQRRTTIIKLIFSASPDER
ncbi:MAG TPA: hypothetical protein VGM33_18685 [Baekduia sp.]|jgi:hypothetical protein